MTTQEKLIELEKALDSERNIIGTLACSSAVVSRYKDADDHVE